MALSPTLLVVHVVIIGLALAFLASLNVGYHIMLWVEYLTTSVPLIEVEMTDAEAYDDGVKSKPLAANQKISLIDPKRGPKFLQCYDPATKQHLGEMKAMTASDVHDLCVKAKIAQEKWSKTTFAQRRQVLRTLQKYICHHVEDICRVASRDSGKVIVDALLGEVLTTCEKIRTIVEWGEIWLRPSYRPTGPMMMHKSARVEYVPLGIIAPIAPWNYPYVIYCVAFWLFLCMRACWSFDIEFFLISISFFLLFPIRHIYYAFYFGSTTTTKQQPDSTMRSIISSVVYLRAMPS